MTEGELMDRLCALIPVIVCDRADGRLPDGQLVRLLRREVVECSLLMFPTSSHSIYCDTIAVALN